VEYFIVDNEEGTSFREPVAQGVGLPRRISIESKCLAFNLIQEES
jgi:hypothetical protein